jgi:septal ring factor EnvC (AmiA/AmiB activator)
MDMICNNCGSRAEEGWRFCRQCGHELAAAASWPAAPAAPPAALPVAPVRLWRRGWFRRAAAVTAILALAGGLVFTVVNDVQTHSTLHTTQGTLAATASRLASTQKELAGTKDTLATTKNDLAGTRQQLTDAQQQLAGVKETVSRNTTEINNLGTCLTGVMTALDEGAAGDFAAESATLQKIAGACRSGLANLP